MPNWCSNKIRITGPDLYKIKAIMDEHATVDNAFSFQWFMPRPLGFEFTHSGSRKINDVSYSTWAEIPADQLEMAEQDLDLTDDREVVGDMIIAGVAEGASGWDALNAKASGILPEKKCTDWYTWSLAHWGTKWDAYSTSHNMVGDQVEAWFDTAWSPPEGFYKELTRRFDITLQAWWAECGFSFIGGGEYRSGDEVDTFDANPDGGDWWEDTPADWTEDEEFEPELLPHIQRFIDQHGMHTGG